MVKNMYRAFILFLLAFSSYNSFAQESHLQLLQKAEEYEKQSKYDDARAIYKSLTDNSSVKDSLKLVVNFNIRYLNIKEGKYKEALQQMQKFIPSIEGKTKHENYIKARVLTSIGEAYSILSFKDSAILYYKLALYEVEKAGRDYDTQRADLSHNIGMVYFYDTKYEEAKYHFYNALKIYKDKYSDSKASTYNMLAGCFYMNRELDSAIIFMDSSIQCATSNHVKAPSLNNLSSIYMLLGDYINAEKTALNSMQLKNKSSRLSLGYNYHSLGSISHKNGDFQQAKYYFRTAYNLRTEYNDTIEALRSELGLAAVYESISMPDSAIYLLQDAIRKSKLNGKNKEQLLANAYHNLANVYIGREMYDIAQVYLDSAIEIRQKRSDRLELIQSLDNKIDILVYKNKIAEAKAVLLNTEKLYSEISVPESDQNVNDNYVKIYLATGQIDSALVFIYRKVAQYSISWGETKYRNKLINNSVVINPKGLIKTYNQLASAYFQKYKEQNNTNYLDSSYKYLAIAEEVLIDNNTKRFNLFDLYEYNNQAGSIYQQFVDVFFAKYTHSKNGMDLQQCISFIEKAKSYVLSQKYRAESSINKFHVPDSIIKRENNYKLSINAKLLALSSEPESKLIVEDYLSTSQRYYSFLSEVRANYPDYYKSRFYSTPVELNKMKEVLAEGELVVDYFISNTALYIVGIMNNRDTLIRVEPSTDLNLAIQQFLSAIQAPVTGSTTLMNANTQLYSSLISPIYSWIDNCSKIVIIPDRLIWFVPFAALFIPTNKFKNYQELDYLVKSKSISYNYSRTVFYQTRINKNKEREKEQLFTGFAPVFCEGCVCNTQSLVTRSVYENSKPIPLPCTLSEINALQTIMTKSGYSTNTFVGKDATLSNFKQQAENSKFIHFATHAFVDTINNKKAYILLSGEHKNSQSDTLGVDEILATDLSGVDFVGLSACQTGVGKFLYGEGALSLGYYFKMAGANSVLATLWAVYDKYTSTLITDFYSEMALTNSSKANALRNSQLKVIKNKNVYPLYWAGFQMISD